MKALSFLFCISIRQSAILRSSSSPSKSLSHAAAATLHFYVMSSFESMRVSVSKRNPSCSSRWLSLVNRSRISVFSLSSMTFNVPSISSLTFGGSSCVSSPAIFFLRHPPLLINVNIPFCTFFLAFHNNIFTQRIPHTRNILFQILNVSSSFT